MKKFAISILTSILLMPLMAETQGSSEYTIEVKSNWDLLGALKDIKDMSIFNRDCISQVWIYSDARGWANYNKSETSSGFLPIDEIKAGRGFWVKGNEECSIEVSESSDTEFVISESDRVYTRDNPKIFTDSEHFYIKLESNPTTGYGWSVGNYDENIFNEPTINYLSDTSEDLVGVGGFDYLFFEFKDITNFKEPTNIVLNYKRNWEEEIANSLTFEILPIRDITKNDLEVNLNRDESEFKVTLEANPTTGFSWKADYNSSIFFEPITSYKVESDLIGAGGVDSWYFKVKDMNLPENSTIKMDYAQHFDGGEVGESLEFKINFAPNSYDIAFGETINIDNGKLIVKFENITDSRCADGVECITAGDVDLQLGITGLLEIYEMQSFKLGENKTNAQGYGITLESVKPLPSIGDMDKSRYIATINIIKPN